jgi:hypothetical protein
MKSLEGESIQVASGSPLRVWIPLEGPADVTPQGLVHHAGDPLPTA